MSLMTLDEAIQHCRDKENCSQCGQEHKQLRGWLEELKDLRTRYNIPTPHGRLIDADRLIAVLKSTTAISQSDYDLFNHIVQLIKHQPTVIEAED